MNRRKKSPSKKTTSPNKKIKYCQKFLEVYSKEYPCLIKSQLSDDRAYCTLCAKDFYVSHGGRDDCRRHVLSKIHADYAKASTKTKDVSSYFVKQDEDLAVINAECMFARFIIEHNLPIAAADHAKHLFKEMFPDSEIAAKYSSGRTKCSSIIKSMAKNTVSQLAEVCKNKPFSLSTDGSNDCDDKKLYPALITYFDDNTGKVSTDLLSLMECANNTGEGIFMMLNEDLKRKGLSWENCISFSADNANTMLGKKKGVAAYINSKNSSVIIRGCPCHLLHIAARKASSVFEIDIQMFLVDIYFFLDKSSKRKINFKKEQEGCEGLKAHKILKYSSTRWLSLLTCIDRVLEQWVPLTAFFCDESNNSASNKRFLNVKSAFENPKVKLILLFLQSALPLFNKLNLLLQQDEPLIHKVKRNVNQFFMDLLVRFVKPSAISDLSSVDDKKFLKKEHQKDDENIVIGAKTKIFLKENLKDKDVKKFYADVRSFYCEACSYTVSKILKYDEFLSHAEVADVSIRTKVNYSSLEYMINLFPLLIVESSLDQLETEFASYQADNLEGISITDRIDNVWSKIAKLKDFNGAIKYKFLPTVMKAILIVPHANASSERLFSLVRKNQTDFRPNLGINVLESLIVEKVKMFSTKNSCYQKKFTEKDLKDAKTATKNDLIKNDNIC